MNGSSSSTKSNIDEHATIKLTIERSIHCNQYAFWCHFEVTMAELNANDTLDYEVTEDGIFYKEQFSDEGEESDPLASDSDTNDAEREAGEEIFGASIDDLIAESRGLGRKRRRRQLGALSAGSKRARPSDVPSHLASVMGNATLAYMSKKFDEAEAALTRVIEEAPKSAAAYRMLGLIYEERGEKMKALETFTMAAEYDSRDKDLCKRNAALWEEAGEKDKAIYCLTKALRGTKGKDAEALKARGILYMELKKHRMAGDSFIKLSRLVPNDVSVGLLIVQMYKEVGEIQRAVAPVEAMVRYCEQNSPKSANADAVIQHESTLSELIQVLIEIRFKQRLYYEASLLLGRLQNRSRETGRPMTFVQRLMLAVCQHRLGSPTLASPTFLEFMASPSAMSKHSFLLWQVADACGDGGDYAKAVRAYTLLVQMEDRQNLIELHLRRATCHKELGNRDAAREDLELVLSIEPRHVEASLRLMEFLDEGERANMRKEKQRSKKLQALETMEDLDAPRARIPGDEKRQAHELLRMANTLYDNGDFTGFLSKLYPALEAALHLDTFPDAKERVARLANEADDGIGGDEVDEMEGLSSDDEGKGMLNQKLVTGDRSEEIATLFARISGKNQPEEQNSKLHTVGAAIMRLLDSDYYVEIAERFVAAFRAEGSLASAHPLTKLFDSLTHLRTKNKTELRARLKMLDITTALAAGDVTRAYDQARLMALEAPMDSDIWFAFSLADQYLSKMSDQNRIRTSRFINRLVKRNPTALYMLLVGGNCAAMGGMNTSVYALGMYLKAFQLYHESALICLCAAVQMMYVAMSRTVENRNEMVLHAFAFLDQYRRNRIQSPNTLDRKWLKMETSYNIGRAMHHLGLVHLAADMYHGVLEQNDEGTEDIPAWVDIRRDAAYNLAQIYRQSGSEKLAAATIARYLIF